ncbi:class I SAM-dependent methyltransferase [Phenylobacterium aquaticum]|uniref:class I SAM-dependent methyltransferase n=1 Tax=Phenylobacterium aquaticum TaxID=1763816 RepID=UPI0026EAF1ED|nr:class I SAM-dependent methyltransferase [Phenylobacterium aquaticum]
MALRDRLIAQIRASGPITVAQYMTACLHDPQDGYYTTRPALGADGDFITAPLVSQMFGELIGLWLVETWAALGRPAPFRLVEMGPGDGTLKSDILRAARLAPDFLAAAELWLVEISEPLRARQAARLGQDRTRWAGSLAEVPQGAPLLLVANELLDCLPPRQFVRTGRGWAERMISVSASGELDFGLGGAMPFPVPAVLGEAPAGAVLEISAAQSALGAELGDRLARDGGAALLIDYGRDAPGFGDTLQALRRHVKVDPLAEPGQADLTVHADFPAVTAAARAAGCETAPVLTQGEFLVRLGIGSRAEALAHARPDMAERIERQLERLISPDQMGELFKVACLHQPGLAPPAFES